MMFSLGLEFKKTVSLTSRRLGLEIKLQYYFLQKN